MKVFEALTVKRRGKWLVADLYVAGKHYRYKLDMEKLEADFMRRMRAMEVAGHEVGWSLKKMWKKVKKTARKVVKSKVWKVAEKAASLGAMLPPPYGPALASAAAGMKTTRALIAARKHAKKGDKKRARKLVRAAAKVARRYPGMMTTATRAAKGPLYLALVG